MSRTIIFILSFFPLWLQAQITAPLSNAIRLTSYPVTPRQDSIFIFCTDDDSDRGTLYATGPAGKGPFVFTWTMYETTGGTYSLPVKTESGTSSTASSLTEGGYKVNISNGVDYNRDFYAWVFLDRPVAIAALRNFTCDYVALDGTAQPDPFYYYDPSSGAQRLLSNTVTFLWSSTPASVIPYPDKEDDPITYSPPLFDVEYRLQVTDNSGCMNTSSFDYTSIHVKADFSAEPTDGSAPLEVTFSDKSVRASYYTWKFGDDSISHDLSPAPHVFYTPGEYTVTLVIESDLMCIDSASVKVTVKPADLKIPDVFSPDNDGVNDFWLLRTVSLKYLNVQVFAKSGHRVYIFQGKGDEIQNWQGWDGKINNSERDAEPGVYYYVIRARGYDDAEFEGRDYRGVLYLFR